MRVGYVATRGNEIPLESRGAETRKTRTGGGKRMRFNVNGRLYNNIRMGEE